MQKEQEHATVEFVQSALTNLCNGLDACSEGEAALILAMADLKGDRRVSADQVLFTASMMARTKKPKSASSN